MHQGRGLERVIRAFVAELRSGQRAEFIVDQREKPLHRGLAALAPHASQDLGDAVHRYRNLSAVVVRFNGRVPRR
jgi:hypothetical protein